MVATNRFTFSGIFISKGAIVIIHYVRFIWSIGIAKFSGSFWLEENQCAPVQLSHKPPDMPLKPNQALVVNTPGAGGYGDPKKRSKELIKSDKVSGKFSDKFLRKFYKN